MGKTETHQRAKGEASFASMHIAANSKFSITPDEAITYFRANNEALIVYRDLVASISTSPKAECGFSDIRKVSALKGRRATASDQAVIEALEGLVSKGFIFKRGELYYPSHSGLLATFGARSVREALVIDLDTLGFAYDKDFKLIAKFEGYFFRKLADQSRYKTWPGLSYTPQELTALLNVHQIYVLKACAAGIKQDLICAQQLRGGQTLLILLPKLFAAYQEGDSLAKLEGATISRAVLAQDAVRLVAQKMLPFFVEKRGSEVSFPVVSWPTLLNAFNQMPQGRGLKHPGPTLTAILRQVEYTAPDGGTLAIQKVNKGKRGAGVVYQMGPKESAI